MQRAKASKTARHQQQKEQTTSSASGKSTSSGRYAEILALQGSVGNRAVNQLLASRQNNRVSPTPTQSGILQRKCSSCGQSTAAKGQCAECEQTRSQLQRRSAKGSQPSQVPPIVGEVLRSPGQPLDTNTRTFMESGFGHDFSSVRVHTDTKAAESARAVNADAYTVGQDIAFSQRRYQPSTTEGRKLLAHELTHVVQQSQSVGNIQRSLAIGSEDNAYERQAEQVASQVVADREPVTSFLTSAPLSVQRACGPEEVGQVSGCIGVGGDVTDVTGEDFLFQVNCDDLRPGEETKLRAFADTLVSEDILKIHGFASEEGPSEFNENLSCLRSHKAARILLQEQVSSTQIQELYKHGATPGSREERRSVVIEKRNLYREDGADREICTNLIDSCEFYLCRERKHPCGDDGYYKGYGYKYCQRFTEELKPKLSDPGKLWLEKARLCLMEYVDDNIALDAPCEQAKSAAFDSHPGCYVKSGICSLEPSDWLEILSTIDVEDHDLKQVIISGISCISNWLPLSFPATGLGAGGGYRGLMERDRQRLMEMIRGGR